MPMYEYFCDDCNRTTEVLRRMDEADEPIDCEGCGSTQTRRTQSVFAAASGSTGADPSTSPCGRCGDPGGSCGM